MRWIALLSSLPAWVLPLSAAFLVVRPDANLGGNGAPHHPFRTLPEALMAAAAARVANPDEPVTLLLQRGRYELKETLKIGPAHSGITLRAAVPGQAVVSGGRRITGWKEAPGGQGLWEVRLPEFTNGRPAFHHLFVNGQRAQRARTPNRGFFQTRAALGTQSPIDLPFRPGDLKPEWARYPDAQVVLLMKWTDWHLPLVAVDTDKGVAELLGGPRASWMDEPDARYWVENVPDALDQPGEWYLDTQTGWLRYLAPKGLRLNRVPVVAARLTELVRVEGDPGSVESASESVVQGVTFSGITFAETDDGIPSEGLQSPQSAVPIRGAFRATHATDCVIEDCTFADLGGYALELGQGAQRWRVTGNVVRDIGAGGLRIGEPGNAQPSARDACHSHQITDNEILRLGRVFPAGCGVIVFQSGTNTIAHNHIADLYYTGISVGWNWGYQETPCRANVIEYNLVERVGQGRLSDMGGFYTLGPQPGTVIRNNIFRDIQSYRYGGWALYTDEGSTGIVVENNIATRCTDAGFHQHYGRDNVIRNNLLAWNTNHSVMRTRSEPHRSFWFTNNVIITQSGTLLGSDWSGGTNQFTSDGNLWFDRRQGTNVSAYRFAGQSWEEWRQRGQEAHSRIADPLLVDDAHPEKGLRKNSPAYVVGFQPIDVSTVGPRPKNLRRRPVASP